MCGIAGAVGHLDASVLDAVRAMSERQTHRGPDAEGFFASAEAGPGVALAHRRLAIIDISDDGNQPMTDPESGAVIVFNGELYNYRALRRELEAKGVSFRSQSDTEVLLKAYGAWGEDCLERLNGMFGFAIWDRARRQLFLARDRLGIKPVYVAQVGHGERRCVLFASELRGLLQSGLVERRLDPTALETYLWHGFVAGEQALARGVERLAPGTARVIPLGGGEVRSWRFWSLPAESSAPHAEAELAETLEEAVRLRLVADVPLGVFLSGGIDSSAVTALAARVAPGQLRTFNVGFEEAGFDESPYARAVAEHVGATHTEVRLSHTSFAERLDDALGGLDQPSFDAINTYFVSRTVREAGITVALAGTGGDELFGGYPSFRDVPRLARVSRLAGVLPALLRDPLANAVARWRQGPPGSVASQVRWGKLRDALSLRGRFTELYQLSASLFTPGFAQSLAPGLDWGRTSWGLAPDQLARWSGQTRGASALHAVSTLELSSFIGERLLPDTDTASMAVALEVRVPLLDHRVVEACARVGSARRFEPLGRKGLLRELGLRDLPADLFDRPKRGFELPMHEWMTGGAGSTIGTQLRDRIADSLGDAAACEAVGLDPQVVGTLWRALREGEPGVYWSRPWSLFVLLDWCRRERMSL